MFVSQPLKFKRLRETKNVKKKDAGKILSSQFCRSLKSCFNSLLLLGKMGKNPIFLSFDLTGDFWGGGGGE